MKDKVKNTKRGKRLGVKEAGISCCEMCTKYNNPETNACGFEFGEEKCKPELKSKEKLLQMFLASKSSEDVELCEDIHNALRIAYGASEYDIYMYKLEHPTCDKCDGSGVMMSEDMSSIDPCDKCLGEGQLTIQLPPENMIPVWFVRGNDESGNICSTFMLKTEEDAIKYKDSIAFNDDYTVEKFYVSKECETDDYNKTTMILFTTNENPFTIMSVSNLSGIHKVTHIPFYIDISKYTNGNYRVMTMDKFNQEYAILRNSKLNKLYMNYFSNEIINYCDSWCTYGGCESMMRAYITKYPTIEDIQNDLYSSIKLDYVKIIKDEQIKLIDKVIEDFSLIGCNIDRSQSARVIDDLYTVLKEDVMSVITGTNTAVAYIMEYICLLLEYDELSDIKNTL